MTTSATTLRARTGAAFGLADPDTYRRTLHLLADLPIGLATCTAAVGLLACAAGLAVTLVGIPLLALTLAAARGLARLERARARTLLGVDVPAPAQPRGWRARLTDAAAWRALGYAVLLGPVGLVTGMLVLLGWGLGVGAVTFPLYAWTLADPAVHLGGVTLSGVPAGLTAVVVGVLLLSVLPGLVRLLSRADAVLVRTLLH